jgi:hypothetical protein
VLQGGQRVGLVGCCCNAWPSLLLPLLRVVQLYAELKWALGHCSC